MAGETYQGNSTQMSEDNRTYTRHIIFLTWAKTENRLHLLVLATDRKTGSRAVIRRRDGGECQDSSVRDPS